MVAARHDRPEELLVPSRLRLLLAAPVILAGLAACGGAVVTAEETAEKAEDALEEQLGVRQDVSCPDDLEAEEGAETRCVLTTAGDDPIQFGVTVTVTSVDGDTVNFDIEVDDEPSG
jgi:Domain of unknown function (DUF4333)